MIVAWLMAQTSKTCLVFRSPGRLNAKHLVCVGFRAQCAREVATLVVFTIIMTSCFRNKFAPIFQACYTMWTWVGFVWFFISSEAFKSCPKCFPTSYKLQHTSSRTRVVSCNGIVSFKPLQMLLPNAMTVLATSFASVITHTVWDSDPKLPAAITQFYAVM